MDLENIYMISQKRIAHFGTFDVDNYGDSLFPLIAEFRLPNYKWDHISPTKTVTVFNDAKQAITFKNAIRNKYDGVVTGGGNIIHFLPNQLTVYNQFPGFSYANLWVGALKLAVRQKVPHIFNAPGIPVKFSGVLKERIARKAFSNSNYASVREYRSKTIIKNIYNSKKDFILEIPDTAFDIAKMWPLKSEKKDGYLIVNLNQRYHNPITETGNNLNEISKKLNLPIKFVIIGACHGDLEFTQKVASYVKVDYEITHSNNLKEMAHLIGKANYFFGSSMHGLISALAYNTPAYLVLNTSPIHKFNGLMKLVGSNDDFIHSSFKSVIENLDFKIILAPNFRDDIHKRLDKHWFEIEEIFKSGQSAKSSLLIDNYEFILKADQYLRKLKKRLSSKLRCILL